MTVRLRLLSLVPAALVAVLIVPLAARAQTANSAPAVDLERLSLDPSGEGSLIVGGGLLLPEGQLRFAFAGEYERNPLALQSNDSTTGGAVIANRVTAHLLAAYGITHRLEVGLEVPLILAQGGGANLSGDGISTPSSFGLDNPLVQARFSILSHNREDPFNLAVRLGVSVPLGTSSAYGGSGGSGTAVIPGIEASRQFGPIETSLQGSLLLRSTQEVGSSEADVQAAVGLACSSWKPEIIGRLGVPLANGLSAGFEAMLAARHTLGTPSVEAFALAGVGAGDLIGMPAWRGLLGVDWRPGFEQSPEPTPEPKQEAKPAEPPPPPAAESKAEPKPEAKADPCAPGHVHTADQCPDLDDDSDGIPNGKDKCPTQAGPGGNDGCPVKDSDNDGVPDVSDKCPNEPGPADNNGCPVKDSDNDGVPDNVDNCPNESGPGSNHGCPAAKKQVVSIEKDKETIRIKSTVNFEKGKAKILKNSYTTLVQLVEVLNAHKELTKLVVEGHTDNSGSAATNQKLSEERAKAVLAYLEKHGVGKDRLTAKGFGSTRPVDTNDTEAGRAHNRRVDIVSVEGAK